MPQSAFGRPSFPDTRANQRPRTRDGEKQALWVPMLNNASKGKDLAEKQLLVLGGTPEQQREFLETLNPEQIRHRYGGDRRRDKKVPISNKYALGYTYHDVLDADQEDILARLNIYLLSNPSSSLVPLLRPLLTPKTVPDTLVAILLDWADPFKWPRLLRQWIRLLRSVIVSLDDETKIEMEEVMTAWKERRIGPDAQTSVPGGGGGGTTEQKATQIVSLGPGEWDEGLGVPVSVICINTEKIERLEQDYGWQEDQFDFLMQWMRTVLLKHGASLIYTTNFDASNVRTLLHSSLSIHSLLKKDTVKHNVVDRDKVLIPPNWDSWGKIRVLKEGFDPEAVADAWSIEIQAPPEEVIQYAKDDMKTLSENESAVAVFEAVLPDPGKDRSSYKPITDTETAVTVPDTQTFLAQQAAALERLKAEDEQAGRRARKGAPAPTGTMQGDLDNNNKPAPNVAEHIGPYQINVNGIDFDAEEATRRLREREADRTRERESQRGSGVSTPRKDKPAGGEASEGGKPSNEALATFFSDLMKKGKGRGSGAASPTRGSPAPDRSRG